MTTSDPNPELQLEAELDRPLSRREAHLINDVNWRMAVLESKLGDQAKLTSSLAARARASEQRVVELEAELRAERRWSGPGGRLFEQAKEIGALRAASEGYALFRDKLVQLAEEVQALKDGRTGDKVQTQTQASPGLGVTEWVNVSAESDTTDTADTTDPTPAQLADTIANDYSGQHSSPVEKDAAIHAKRLRSSHQECMLDGDRLEIISDRVRGDVAILQEAMAMRKGMDEMEQRLNRRLEALAIDFQTRTVSTQSTLFPLAVQPTMENHSNGISQAPTSNSNGGAAEPTQPANAKPEAAAALPARPWTPSSRGRGRGQKDAGQLALEAYLAHRVREREGMRPWPEELPVFWEGGDPAGLGRDRV